MSRFEQFWHGPTVIYWRAIYGKFIDINYSSNVRETVICIGQAMFIQLTYKVTGCKCKTGDGDTLPKTAKKGFSAIKFLEWRHFHSGFFSLISGVQLEILSKQFK